MSRSIAIAAARLGVSTAAIDNALNNAYSPAADLDHLHPAQPVQGRAGGRSASCRPIPSLLDRIYVGAANGKQVPLSAVAHFVRDTAPLAVASPGPVSRPATLSFNMARGMSLGDATAAIEQAARELRMPETCAREFAGNARFLRAIAEVAAAADRRGAAVDLHRARRAV